MSKKNVTAERVKECIDKAGEMSGIAFEISEAISKCRIDEIPDALGAAREMVVASRDLAQLVCKLLNLNDLQTLQAKNAASRAELDK